MLHIYFGGIIVDDKDIIPNLMEYPDMYFDNQIKKGWITSTLAKEMIYDVDKSEVKGDNCIYSPVLGMIPPTKLSGGVKALLVMLNDKGSRAVYNASVCGDNCSKWILKIAETKDIEIRLGHLMRFREHLSAICMNDGDKIEGESEYIAKYMKYMYG